MSSLTAASVRDAVKLRSNATEDDLQVVIRAAYRQVLGNAHMKKILSQLRQDSNHRVLATGLDNLL